MTRNIKPWHRIYATDWSHWWFQIKRSQPYRKHQLGDQKTTKHTSLHKREWKWSHDKKQKHLQILSTGCIYENQYDKTPQRLPQALHPRDQEYTLCHPNLLAAVHVKSGCSTCKKDTRKEKKIKLYNTLPYLFCIRILNLFRRKYRPISIKATSLFLLVINQYAVCGVRADDECVNMSQLICFTCHILLDQMIFPITGKNCMDLLCAVTTDVWPKHNTASNQPSKCISDQHVWDHRFTYTLIIYYALDQMENNQTITCNWCHHQMSSDQCHHLAT